MLCVKSKPSPIECPEDEEESYTPRMSNQRLGDLVTGLKEGKGEEPGEKEGKRESIASTRTSVLITPMSLGRSSMSSSAEGRSSQSFGSYIIQSAESTPHALSSALEEIKEEILPEIEEEEEKLGSIWRMSSSESFRSSIDSISSGRETYPEIPQNFQEQFRQLLSLRNSTFSLDALTNKYFISTNHGRPFKKTVFLDLDQTLIYSFLGRLPPAGLGLPFILTPNLVSFVVRKGARKLVCKLAQRCELILYSAGSSDYVNEIIHNLHEFRSNFTHILTRDDCYHVQDKEIYLKCARIMKERNIEDIIIVDDSFWVYPNELDNIIPVAPFAVNEFHNDEVLKEILEEILLLLKMEDIRPALRNKYHLSDQINVKLKSLGLFHM